MHIGPNIVEDGLVLYLDAANKKSYPGTGTSWYDLSGNGNTGVLTNGPTFDSANVGSIVFDKVDDFVNLGNIFNYTTESFSFCGWVSLLSLTSNRTDGNINTIPLLYKGAFQLRGYYITLRTSAGENLPNTVAFVTNQSGTRQATIGTLLSDTVLSRWYHIGVTRDGSTAKIYLDGIDRTTSSESHINPTFSNEDFTISSYNNNYLLSNAKHALWLGYNRALTPQEILQNYNATKGRYL